MQVFDIFCKKKQINLVMSKKMPTFAAENMGYSVNYVL